MDNQNKTWTESDIIKLKSMAAINVDTSVIAKWLGRSKQAVYDKASELGITLKPKDK